MHQRFTAAASAFLNKCLLFVLKQRLKYTAPVQTELLRNFRHVLIVDSSSWSIDEKLRNVLPGSGGAASGANCKLQAAYEYRKGELAFLDVTSGILPDNRYTDHLPDLLDKNDLLLIDQGYFKLDTFRAIEAKGAFFLTRFLANTTLTDARSRAIIDLRKVLRKYTVNALEMQVLMGPKAGNGVPGRLVCLRVSEQVANERRRRLRKEAIKKGRTVSKHHLELCSWTLLVTNISESWLPFDMVRALYTLRWQIELLFKQLKSILRVHQSDTANEHRLRCELYGKLIMAVLLHRIHAAANSRLWNNSRRELSMDKFYKRIQERAFTLLVLFLSGLRHAVSYLHNELKVLIAYCTKNRQRSRLTTLEMLDSGFDPRLDFG